MKTFAPLAALATVVTLAVVPTTVFAETQSVREVTEAAPVAFNAGTMLYSSAGYRVAPIYRVSADGNPQVILNGRLVTVPASTLSTVDGKVATSLTKKEIAAAK